LLSFFWFSLSFFIFPISFIITFHWLKIFLFEIFLSLSFFSFFLSREKLSLYCKNLFFISLKERITMSFSVILYTYTQ
jgi:hypothetical protein